jgi:hypothetical protein
MSEKDSKPNVPITQEQLLKSIEELLKQHLGGRISGGSK